MNDRIRFNCLISEDLKATLCCTDKEYTDVVSKIVADGESANYLTAVAMTSAKNWQTLNFSGVSCFICGIYNLAGGRLDFSDTPKWFEFEKTPEIEELVRKEIDTFVKAHTHYGEYNPRVTDGIHVFDSCFDVSLGGTARVLTIRNSTVTSVSGNSVVHHICENSFVGVIDEQAVVCNVIGTADSYETKNKELGHSVIIDTVADSAIIGNAVCTNIRVIKNNAKVSDMALSYVMKLDDSAIVKRAINTRFGEM